MVHLRKTLKRTAKFGRYCIYIAFGLAFFIDATVRPLWDSLLQPWMRIFLVALLSLFFFGEYYLAFQHSVSWLLVFSSYVPAVIGCYQFAATSISGLKTIGLLLSPLHLGIAVLLDNTLAWLLPAISLSFGTIDTLPKMLSDRQLPERVRVIARSAVWYLPAILLAFLPAVFPTGYNWISPIPVRELAVFVIMVLACFIWLVELPGYAAISQTKRYLHGKLWRLESCLDRLARSPNYSDTMSSLIVSNFQVVPNPVARETSRGCVQFPSRDERAQELGLTSATINGWFTLLRRIETRRPNDLARVLQEVALHSTCEFVTRLKKAGIALSLDLEDVIKRANALGVQQTERSWRESIASDIRSYSVASDSNFTQETHLPFFRALIGLCIAWEQLVLEPLVKHAFAQRYSLPLKAPAISSIGDFMDYDWWWIMMRNSIEDDWRDIRHWNDASPGEQSLFLSLGEFWIWSAFDGKQWCFFHYPYARISSPETSVGNLLGGALVGEFDASDYLLTLQLVQKGRDRVRSESSHPFPEVAALVSLAGVGTLIAIALRFI